MGYTHYFRQHRNASRDEWERIRLLTTKLFEALPPNVRIDDQDGGPPIADHTHIWFNGIEDEGCETFQLTRCRRPLQDYEQQERSRMTPAEQRKFDAEGVFDFCKTRSEPYDLVVCAVLAVAAYVTRRNPAWTISSDGEPGDWQPALDWATQALGFLVPCPLLPPCESVGDVSGDA